MREAREEAMVGGLLGLAAGVRCTTRQPKPLDQAVESGRQHLVKGQGRRGRALSHTRALVPKLDRCGLVKN